MKHHRQMWQGSHQYTIGSLPVTWMPNYDPKRMRRNERRRDAIEQERVEQRLSRMVRPGPTENVVAGPDARLRLVTTWLLFWQWVKRNTAQLLSPHRAA